MLKRTLVLQSPGHVSLEQRQLCFAGKDGERKTVPLEDVGIVILESQALTMTSALLTALMENNALVLLCDGRHLPQSLLLPMTGNSLAQKVIGAQLSAPESLLDRLWKQTVAAKIRNQAECLKRGGREQWKKLLRLSESVRSGDPDNVEGTAARCYFQSHVPGGDFLRERDGAMPNGALNYGYAILRAAVARSLVSSGLLTVVGIHHHGQYNAHCLADDVMEPYRPFVDDAVFNGDPGVWAADGDEITPAMKRVLLSIPAADVLINGSRRPLASALSQTTASLARCFLKEDKEILYPEFAP